MLSIIQDLKASLTPSFPSCLRPSWQLYRICFLSSGRLNHIYFLLDGFTCTNFLLLVPCGSIPTNFTQQFNADKSHTSCAWQFYPTNCTWRFHPDQSFNFLAGRFYPDQLHLDISPYQIFFLFSTVLPRPITPGGSITSSFLFLYLEVLTRPVLHFLHLAVLTVLAYFWWFFLTSFLQT